MRAISPAVVSRTIKAFLVACIFGSIVAQAQPTPFPPPGGGFPSQTPTPTTDTPQEPNTPKSGRILDDSTKQVYGPQTSRYIQEEDLLNNRDSTYAVDTLLDNLHSYNFVNRFGNRYADLGNLGTALRPVFYVPPAQIGTYLGINAFAPYAFEAEQVKYYDTKSPYTNVRYVQGGLFQQLFEAGHSRNINPRWNVGFDYRRIVAPKQFAYQPPARREERMIDHHAVVAYTRWMSEDSLYHALLHFSHLNHTQNEVGGLLDSLSANRRQEDLLDDFAETGSSQLAPSQGGQQLVRSIDFRNRWHLYHQYKFANGFQVYHVFDRQAHRYSYTDLQPLYEPFRRQRGRFFYPDVFPNRVGDYYYFSDTATRDQIRYVAYENRFGVKGKFRGWDYRLYARRRDFRVDYTGQYDSLLNTPYQPVRVRRGETYLGAWGQLRLTKDIRLQAEGEYLLFRDYKLHGTLESPWFKAGYLSMLHSPTLVQQRMWGNHFRWDENFAAVSVNQLYGQLNLRYKALHFEPKLTLTNLANYIYFDTFENGIRPAQSGPFQIINAGATLAWHGRVFHAVNEVVFTQTTNNVNVIRIPQWFANARWYLEGFLFRKALYMQIGVEGHYRSDYYADAYMPAIGQFHLQNEFLVRAYPVVDVFANARVGRVRIFAKMSHVNDGLLGNGYFVTPYYPGQRRVFGFGVSWPLFD